MSERVNELPETHVKYVLRWKKNTSAPTSVTSTPTPVTSAPTPVTYPSDKTELVNFIQ
jgi:hypothetical protein